MKLLAAIASFAIAAPAAEKANAGASNHMASAATLRDLPSVAPALAHYAEKELFGGLWHRPQLSRRDRSIVTLTVLIARQQTIDLQLYVNLALDQGVKPREISEIITHLAFYAGWSSAMAAVPIVKDIFAERRITADQLPEASPRLDALDIAGEAARAARVDEMIGHVAPGLVQYTTDHLFRDLWLRPDLAPRDRSLVTISSLMALGQTAQLASHLGRALDNGLTRKEAGEVITQVAFYAGWPNAFSAATVAAEVFRSRPH
jgi:4-carboxymuconolactone decarboxylase